MDHVLLDPLEDGALALYEFGGPLYYVWQSPHWNIVATDGPDGSVLEREEVRPQPGWDERRRWSEERRSILTMDLDEPLTILHDTLVDRLGALTPRRQIALEGDEIWTELTREEVLAEPGTLVLATRQCQNWDHGFEGWKDWTGKAVEDRHGVLVMGALGYFPGVQRGRPMTAAEAPRYLEQACLGLAGKPYDVQIGAVQDLIVERIRSRRQRAEQMAEADVKARAILWEHLDDRQRAEFEERKQFHVRGRDGFTYLIVDKGIHNVFRVNAEDKPIVEYCIVTETSVPNCDQMLTQKLLLEADPATFHKWTNAWELSEKDGKKVRRFLDPETFEVHDVPDAEVLARFIQRVVA